MIISNPIKSCLAIVMLFCASSVQAIPSGWIDNGGYTSDTDSGLTGLARHLRPMNPTSTWYPGSASMRVVAGVMRYSQ